MWPHLLSIDCLNSGPNQLYLSKPVCVENLEYKLKFNADVDNKNCDIIEAVEVNFDGALDNLKVVKDDLDSCIHVQKEQEMRNDKVTKNFSLIECLYKIVKIPNP